MSDDEPVITKRPISREEFGKIKVPQEYLDFLKEGGVYPEMEFVLDDSTYVYFDENPPVLWEDGLPEYIIEIEGDIYLILGDDDEMSLIMACTGEDYGKIFLYYDEDDEVYLETEPVSNGFTDMMKKVKRGIHVPEKIQHAFDMLENKGIVARGNWACCQNCGHAEIGEAIEEYEEEGKEARGYVFYHQQDTPGAVIEGSTYLAYGTLDDNEEEYEKIANEIAEILKAGGLKVKWDGSTSSRILISGAFEE